MAKRLYFLTATVILVFLVSCQKEIDWQLSRVNSNDSTLIGKVVLLDTTLSAPFDSSHVYEFKYDAQKRVNLTYHIVWVGAVKDTITRTQFFYQGNDTLPFRMLETYSSGGSVERFSSYDGIGRLSTDSTVENTAIMQIINARRYTYLPNRLKYEVTLRIPSQSIVAMDTSYLEQHWTARNITLQKDTIDYSPMGGGIYYRYSTIQYDNTSNPFTKYYHRFGFYDFGVWLTDNFCRNNFKEVYQEYIDVLLGQTTIQHVKYDYVYNAIELPIICREKDLTTSEVTKYVYFYTK